MSYICRYDIVAARYDTDASRYHQGVYKRKRADLIHSIDSTLSPLFLGQLKNLHKSCLVQFKSEILTGLKGEDYNFAEVVGKSRQACEERFEHSAKEALVQGTDWVWEDEMESLKEEISYVADQCRKDETKKMVNLIEVSSYGSFGMRRTFVLTGGWYVSVISRSRSRSLWISL